MHKAIKVSMLEFDVDVIVHDSSKGRVELKSTIKVGERRLLVFERNVGKRSIERRMHLNEAMTQLTKLI
ncbi:hypothetical protein KSB_55570 [Ktedonobacter robiniae]|uniref:Uncharacterized protein n=1 Tax=Ktedonobacter robiniae TaxID=2778365 RepID=A0ABQ3UWN2_9CHLR|nr:hypothetical protein KSB_55570 [Ktedonobacter robiniae]